MNKHILEPEVQAFLNEKAAENPQKIALQKSPFPLVSSGELANQLDGHQRSVSKLPTWVSTEGIYYPDKINIEQSSSEKTAALKLRLIEANSRLIDLTGGFGVDSYYFSTSCKEVLYCELNEQLAEIVAYNAGILGATNIRFSKADGLGILNEQEDGSLDYIYVDPSRRNKNQRFFLLEECEPDIVGLQDVFFQKAKTVISKVSPLLDISKAISQLKHCKSVTVVSVDGDCKELVFVQERDFSGHVKIQVIALIREQVYELSYPFRQEKEIELSYSEPLNYLYDPDVAVLKAGAFKTIAQQYNIHKLHQHSHLYSSSEWIPDFIGRSFHILDILPFASLKKNNPYPKAHVQSKNFPLKVDEIRKKFKIKDGNEIYLFFTTDKDEKLICIAAKKAIAASE
ncbi:class I SAM-dependent methyltransferase [Sphingobacterium hungaricum]